MIFGDSRARQLSEAIKFKYGFQLNTSESRYNHPFKSVIGVYWIEG